MMLLPPAGPEREQWLDGLPQGAAVFVVRLREGRPHVGLSIMIFPLATLMVLI